MTRIFVKALFAFLLATAGVLLIAPQPTLAFRSFQECRDSGCADCREQDAFVWLCHDILPIPAGPGTIQNPIAPKLSPATPEQAIGQFGALLRTIIGALIIGAAVVFFFVFLIGGIKWIVSSGDKTQIESARNTIVNALIGLVIVLSLFAILKLIETIFGFDILQIDIGALKIK